jgi:Na+/proline symporter/signal transduction histidine kinase/CheY-like chemotaxis protein
LFSGWTLLFIAILYVGLLFSIAYLGNKWSKKKKLHPWVYSLSLGVYCTTWSMLGTTRQAATTGWAIAPTYLGTILLLVLGFGLITKITRIVRQHNIISISDFISSRYGKSQNLAILVTLVSLVAIVPYISIQLKALTDSYSLLVETSFQSSSSLFYSPAFVITVLMAIFAILFGTRRINANEKHEGLILALSFESIIKLVAFISIGIYSLNITNIGESFTSVLSNTPTNIELSKQTDSMSFLIQVGLGFVAIFLLPRQFHVIAVENNSVKELKTARWVFPIYLILFNLLILPMALVGLALFGEGAEELNALILTIPMHQGSESLTLIGFLGVLSAATSMVIIAIVVLSTMLCNDIIVPLFYKKELVTHDVRNLGKKLLTIRRVIIISISFLAYFYYLLISGNNSIASTGLLSFALIAQFAPAVIAAVYWKQASENGAIFGIAIGVIMWIYTLLIPSLVNAGWISNGMVENGLFNFAWLKPTELLGLHGFDQITHGVMWSLGLNALVLFIVSKKSNISIREKIQANKFLTSTYENFGLTDRSNFTNITPKDLFLLIERFLGTDKTKELISDYETRQGITNIDDSASREFIAFTEHILNGALGSASTKLVMDSVLKSNQDDFNRVVNIVEEASEAFKFNRELLQSAVENISHGISVIDADLNLVAWNSRYLSLFDYPKDLVVIGRPIADLIRYNLSMNKLNTDDIEAEVEKRLNYFREGSAHEFERIRKDGKVLLIRGNLMPGGGFVTSFIDITQIRIQQKALKKSNLNLETRVQQRTEALEQINIKLEIAKAEAEAANRSKTRFLAAASHDVLQPMTAAKLFTEALSNEVKTESAGEIVSNLKQSLNSAENLLNDLLEISKLEAGVTKAKKTTFDLGLLFKQLKVELTPLAEQEQVLLKVHKARYQVFCDQKLLRRILQNFLVNAVRYSDRKKVLMGCRQSGKHLKIQVIDTGPGINSKDKKRIFEEFTRLSNSNKKDSSGHGLGLAIAKAMSQKLSAKINVYSEISKGSCFEILIPFRGRNKGTETIDRDVATHRIQQKNEDEWLVCIDNDAGILSALQTLLNSWGFNVLVGATAEEIIQQITPSMQIKLLLVDYHLDDDRTGVEAIEELYKNRKQLIPAIIISADRSKLINLEAEKKGFYILEKPVKPLALRTLINQFVS